MATAITFGDNVALVSKNVIMAIDTSNIIASKTANDHDPQEYTATQDCYIMDQSSANWGSNLEFYIDGVNVGSETVNGTTPYFRQSPFFLRKGQTFRPQIKGYTWAYCGYIVYGLK